MAKTFSKNVGIQIKNGNLNATNLVVGDNASVSIYGDNIPTQIADITTLRALISEKCGDGKLVAEINSSLNAISNELKKKNPDRTITSRVLSRITSMVTTSGTILEGTDKIVRLIEKIASAI